MLPLQSRSNKRMTPNIPAPTPTPTPTPTARANKTRVHAERHHITGQFYAMSHEDRAAFNKNCQGIIEDINPQSARELWLANAIAEDMWRLDRARGEENNIYALS